MRKLVPITAAATIAMVHAIALSPVPALASAEEAEDPTQRVICKETQRTGTRFKSKDCKTWAQWEAIAEQNRADMKEVVDRPQIEFRRE